MANHKVCHIEWEVTDLQRARAFFEGLFKWDFREFGETMIVFGKGEDHIGGLTKVDQVHPGSSPSVWIDVQDIEVTCALAEKLGGKVARGKEPVPHVGWSAVIQDFDGNSVGLVQFENQS